MCSANDVQLKMNFPRPTLEQKLGARLKAGGKVLFPIARTINFKINDFFRSFVLAYHLPGENYKLSRPALPSN
jgi:hypothetical protein